MSGSRTLLALSVAAAGALYGAQPQWQITTVAFFTNQSCIVTQELVRGRSDLESELRRWDVSALRMVDPESGLPVEAPATPPPTTNNPLADLETRIRRMLALQNVSLQGGTSQVERVDISTNQVRMVTTMKFESLTHLAGEALYTWTPYPFELVKARFETTNGLFRVTLSPSPRAGSALKGLARESSGGQFQFEWRLAFPGALRESAFALTNATQTWVRTEPGNPGSFTNLLPLLQKPLVFAADAAGLVIPAPIESRRVRNRAGQSSVEPELPVTDAGPGFIAEAESLTINTLYRFPTAATNLPGTAQVPNPEDGLFSDESDMDAGMVMRMMQGQSAEGVVVQAKLFAPRGRTIRSVAGLKLLRAVDDQGRPVPEAARKADGDLNSEIAQALSAHARGGSANLQISLALPEPDAQSIETLEAEAIVTTLGDWQTLVITNLQADAKKEIPLDALVPGARMVVTKVETRGSMKVEMKLAGPRDIGLLDFKLRQGRRPVRNSFFNDLAPPATATNATRQVTLQAYDYSGRPAGPQPLSLEMRFPRDTRRERVRITLTALDLL